MSVFETCKHTCKHKIYTRLSPTQFPVSRMGVGIYLQFDLLRSLCIYNLLLVCSVTLCSLGSNQISDEGACAVAAALQVNKNLQELK